MERALLGGRYQVIRRLGSGGFSRTFLVSDLHLPNYPKCVIKQLKVQDKDAATLDMARRLFDTEARVLYQLGNHPQIPSLLAHFEENQEFYLAQEYVEGSRLSSQIEEGKPWSETRVVLLLQEILEILAFVHGQQVIHRDVKPSNLIRRHRNGKLVLIDFGAVKQVTSSPLVDAETGATNLTVAIGTHGYMPNEQYAGKPRFSSDVYAVGMLGIRALTGVHPQKIGEDPVTSELSWQPHAASVSAALAEVLDCMVRYDFRDRYPTATEALEALQNLPTPLSHNISPHLYHTWQRGAGGLVPSPQSNPGEAVLVPADTSEITAIAGTQDATSLFPLDTLYGARHTTQVRVRQQLGQLIASLPPIQPQTLLIVGSLGLVASLVALWQGGITVAFEPANRAVAAPFKSLSMPNLSTELGILLPPREKAAYLVKQADQLVRDERFPEALEIYKAAIAVQTDQAAAYLGRCRALIGLKRPSEAIAACNDALAYRSYYPEATRRKGNAEEQQGRLLAALALYEDTNQLMPALAAAWLDRGRVLQKLGRSAEALNAVDQAIALNRELAEAWTVRGEAAWTLERYDQAIVALDKALQLNPEDPAAKQLREQTRKTLGR